MYSIYRHQNTVILISVHICCRLHFSQNQFIGAPPKLYHPLDIVTIILSLSSSMNVVIKPPRLKNTQMSWYNILAFCCFYHQVGELCEGQFAGNAHFRGVLVPCFVVRRMFLISSKLFVLVRQNKQCIYTTVTRAYLGYPMLGLGVYFDLRY